jgi:ATPase family associated with various cellular activities (AAA)
MDTVWSQSGSNFHPGDTTLQTEKLPPGLYVYKPTLSGWYLERTADRFIFSGKIYGNHDPILNRVQTAWTGLGGNLGVLLNGLKGTGKTVTAQLIANWAVSQGLPVLQVSAPVPLQGILAAVQQPMMVIFDEFEKTHDKEEQQNLLSALDGISRNGFQRLFVFTTNNRWIDTNFVDRPSRIRYCWEFTRLDEATILMLMDDILDPTLAHLRTEILQYLISREVLSIDVVKTVLQETNLFKESPLCFNEVLNLTEKEPPSFRVEILDANRQPVKTLTPFLSLPKEQTRRLLTVLSRTGREEAVQNPGAYRFEDRYTHHEFTFVESTEVYSEWVCHLRVPLEETWLRAFPKVQSYSGESRLVLDVKPEGWVPPSWAVKYQKDVELTNEEDSQLRAWDRKGSVYGNDKGRFLIRITPNKEGPPSQTVFSSTMWND